MRVPRSARLALLLASGVLVISGCGGDSKGADAKSATTSASAASSAVPSSAAGNDAAGDCGAAEMEVRAGLASSGYLTDVKVIGGCTMVSVSTSLAADTEGALAARGMCEIAAVQAYAQGLSSVSIDAKDGTELAIGVKGSPCIAQPR